MLRLRLAPDRALAAPALVLATALALPACATLGGANYVSIEQEWEYGRQVEAEINRQLPLVNDPALERYVEDLGQRMVAQTTMARLPWRFHVVRDARINAFNAPGGLIYVNTGLIAEAGSAAELAGAMAHEIGHGVARHGTQRMSQAQDANLVAAILLGNNASAVEQVAANVVATGAFARFSRADEREADRLGVQLMAEVGYDPEGLARLLERLVEEEQRRPNAVERFFATHPDAGARAGEVRQLARSVDRPGLRMDDAGFASARSRAARYE